MVLLIIIPMKNGYFIGNILEYTLFSGKPKWGYLQIIHGIFRFSILNHPAMAATGGLPPTRFYGKPHVRVSAFLLRIYEIKICSCAEALDFSYWVPSWSQIFAGHIRCVSIESYFLMVNFETISLSFTMPNGGRWRTSLSSMQLQLLFFSGKHWDFWGCFRQLGYSTSSVSPYSGWLRNPSPVDRWFIPLFTWFQPSVWWCSDAGFRNHPQ